VLGVYTYIISGNSPRRVRLLWCRRDWQPNNRLLVRHHTFLEMQPWSEPHARTLTSRHRPQRLDSILIPLVHVHRFPCRWGSLRLDYNRAVLPSVVIGDKRKFLGLVQKLQENDWWVSHTTTLRTIHTTGKTASAGNPGGLPAPTRWYTNLSLMHDYGWIMYNVCYGFPRTDFGKGTGRK